tara:strand:- start:7551 stop:8639 length:1089 start_codon:yes stop_codon:yes gene_type:complete
MGMSVKKGGTKSSVAKTIVAPPRKINEKPRRLDPIKAETIKVIQDNKTIPDKEKVEKIKEVIEDKPRKLEPPKPNDPISPGPITVTPSPLIPPSATNPLLPPSFLPPTVSPDKVPGLPIAPPKVVPRPPSFQPKPDPITPPTVTPISPSPPVIGPSPPVSVTPSPPVTVIPSQPKTSVRMPEAIVRSSPRVYSERRRVVFRPQRLLPPTLKRPPRAAVMKAKPRWKVGKPTSRSFMRRVRPGQFSFQRRGTHFFDRRPSNMEVFKLKRKINKLNADALRTKRDYAAERARLEEELRDYRLSPLTQVRNQAKGVFEVVDKASSPFTPSVNGIDGFPQIGEGTSKALAAGMALFAGLFLIGRVE